MKTIHHDKPLAVQQALQALEAAVLHHASLKAHPALRVGAWALPYAREAVKRARRQLSAVESQAQQALKPQTTTRFTGFSVVENRSVGRYQIYFDNKPSEDIINRLKALNFKWAPRFGAWQNFLTDNGYLKLQQFLKDYE